jgi:chemotaxis protein histidine kinase CheA
MPKVFNPNPGTVHVHIQRLGKSINVAPGLQTISEAELEVFQQSLVDAGVQMLDEMNDTAEPLKESSDEKKGRGKKKDAEPMNEKKEEEKVPAKAEAKEEAKSEKAEAKEEAKLPENASTPEKIIEALKKNDPHLNANK